MTRARGRGELPEPILVGLSWAASLLGISLEHARRLARDGEIPGAFRVGTRWRVSTVVFREVIEARARESARRAPGAPPGSFQPMLAVVRPSVPGGVPRRSERLRGRQIAADAPRPSITGDRPLVRPRRRPQGEPS